MDKKIIENSIIISSPIVSIIVPVYNVEKYLRPCLGSIVAQTFKDYEVVLVDDGSTDDSGKICDEYAEKDDRFVVIHKQNEGVAKARITAFEHSKGKLITFIDSDDYVSPDYLEKLSRPIIEEDADMVSCNFFDVDSTTQKVTAGKLTLQGIYEKEELRDFIANHYFFDHSCHGFGMTNFLWTKMVKRSFVAEGLKDGVGMWFGEDQIAMFSMLYKIAKLWVIPDRLYYYIHYKEQATQRYDASLWDSLIKMFKAYQRLDTEHIASRGLRIRTWLYVSRTISDKMIPSGMGKNTFALHLAQMRQDPFMGTFFRPLKTGLGWKSDIKYWIIKLRLYRLCYVCFYQKDRERTK